MIKQIHLYKNDKYGIKDIIKKSDNHKKNL